MKEPLSSNSEKRKEYQTWSKRVSKNDITEEITVTEAENGYVVTHCTYGYKKGAGKEREYFNKEKKYVAKENPLEEEEEKTFAESLDHILDEIAEEDGMLNVK